MFKTRRECSKCSLASPFHCSPTRTRKPVRWTLALSLAETNPRLCKSRNIAEPASNSPVLQHGFPREITQQRLEPAEIPRATHGTEQRIEQHVGTEQRIEENTWKHTWKQDRATACLTNIKQVTQTKSLITEL